MPGHPPPSFRPRLSGTGLNQGVGEVNEHMDQQAMQQAVQQKGFGQQATQPGVVPPGGVSGAKSQPTQAPRAVTPSQEIKWFGQDVLKGLASFFDLNAVLQIDPAQDDPQKQAKKKQFHQRYSKLTQEEQAFVQQKYKQELQRKQQEQREKEMAQQQKKAQEHQDIAMPTSVKKGPDAGGGSRKQKAVTKLQNDRKSLGTPQGAN